MTTAQLRIELITILDAYEETTRHYLRKMEEDRPEVAAAYWKAVWSFRLTLLEEHDTLVKNLKAARYVPPD